jgi:anthranilate 1,2-dioxygenase small subunit
VDDLGIRGAGQRLPLALIYCESRNMLLDRVAALRETALFVPRMVRHLTGNIRLRGWSRRASA